MTIHPTSNRILFTLVTQSETPSGLFLPDGASVSLPHGLIVAVGPDVVGFAIGDRIIPVVAAIIHFQVPVENPLCIISQDAVLAKYEE